MKKIFALIFAAVAVVGCSTDINEDGAIKLAPRYTAPFAIDMSEGSRSFDADLNWVWDADDTIAAYQAAGGKHVNTLAILNNGKFGVDSFGYDSQDAADFVFVHPAEALNASSYSVSALQTGDWTPVMLGRVSDATIDSIERVQMQHLNAAVEFRFWEPNGAARMDVSSVTISSDSDFVGSWNELGEQTLNGKSLSANSLSRDNYTFNIGTGEFAFTLDIADADGVKRTIEVPAKSYAAGSRTIINVEWQPKITSFTVSSWWTDSSKSEGDTIYLNVEMDHDTAYSVLLDGAVATVTDGKIKNVTPGEHTVRIRIKVRDGYVNSDPQTVMVTGRPTFSYNIYSSYNSTNGTISKDNSKDGKTLYYTLSDLGAGDTNDYIQNNLVESVQWVYGSTTKNVTLGTSGNISGMSLGSYNSYITCVLKNGYTFGGSSSGKDIHITGIPHRAEPPTQALGWSESSWNVSWNSTYVQIGAVSGSGTPAITSPAFHVPENFGINVYVNGYIRTYQFIWWIPTTFTVQVNGSNIISQKSPDGTTSKKPMSVSGSGTLTPSSRTVRCESSYNEAGPYVQIEELHIEYK